MRAHQRQLKLLQKINLEDVGQLDGIQGGWQALGQAYWRFHIFGSRLLVAWTFTQQAGEESPGIFYQVIRHAEEFHYQISAQGHDLYWHLDWLGRPGN